MKSLIFSTPKAETWKDIEGYQGLYQVSDAGRVKSLPNSKHKAELILKHWIQNTKGYHYIYLRNGRGEKRSFAVHRLVLEAFVGKRPNGKQCAHSDGNPANNNLDNLRWATAKENIDDRKRHGRTASGENNGSAKLDEKCVKTINKLKHTGVSAYEIGHLACVSTATIDRVWRGETWRDIN